MIRNLFGLNKNFKILIGYGSMTGAAESISEILLNKLIQKFYHVDRKELNNVEINTLSEYDYIIILLSTTGDGEQPDNAMKFYKKLRKDREINLEEQEYAILGLGSTDYNNFCHASKCLYRIFKRLKMKPFIDIEYADDATGLEAVVEPWLEKIVSYLFDERQKVSNWFIKSMSS